MSSVLQKGKFDLASGESKIEVKFGAFISNFYSCFNQILWSIGLLGIPYKILAKDFSS